MESQREANIGESVGPFIAGQGLTKKHSKIPIYILQVRPQFVRFWFDSFPLLVVSFVVIPQVSDYIPDIQFQM